MIETTHQIPHLTDTVEQVSREHLTCEANLARADELIVAAEAAVADAVDTMQALGRIADLHRDWSATQAAADQLGVTAMTARAEADRIATELRAAHAGTGLQRWRNRRTITTPEAGERAAPRSGEWPAAGGADCSSAAAAPQRRGRTGRPGSGCHW